ncbi:hypothetical protein ACUSIJ_28930 [Pseudochelatococcus sp. B33]
MSETTDLEARVKALEEELSAVNYRLSTFIAEARKLITKIHKRHDHPKEIIEAARDLDDAIGIFANRAKE